MKPPMPRDPRAPHTTPEEVTSQFEAILAEDTESLADEVDALTRAHAVLGHALQERNR
ncbi:hypothetical protein [Corynebacterium coyleae]|uniref:hypothetical protein n=1 Tax=Corynebacterium coyleae TaxID=53374 RepID=UPI00254F1427|nr:hypothetical protein [Corynebacterium coyleae]MDK8663158.1 hypothetical protein [Corynebacterium coyleae]MDK8705796.1 hypothetical protein [Corynebacterium coyleae]MDK8733117.1 hypothetical protein [Corynebacterium coyleae]MDK8891837.1 hypothetical protein [Corynebacterium coyleae]